MLSRTKARGPSTLPELPPLERKNLRLEGPAEMVSALVSALKSHDGQASAVFKVPILDHHSSQEVLLSGHRLAVSAWTTTTVKACLSYFCQPQC